MNNEQMEREAAKIANGILNYHVSETVKREVIALCARVDTEARREQREADAALCEDVADKRTFTQHTRDTAMVCAERRTTKMSDNYESLKAQKDAIVARANAEREMLIYWLLRAYQSGHREGWEAGASSAETMSGLCDVLANLGYDPNLSDAAKELLKRKPVYFVEPRGNA